MFYIKRPKLHIVTQFSAHKVVNKKIVRAQFLNINLSIYCLNHSIKWIVTLSDKLAPPGECWVSCTAGMKAYFSKSWKKFYLNLKVTQWPWSVNLTLCQHCSTVGAMPNKYMAKITVKMQKSKMLHFAMKMWPWQGQIIQWDQIVYFLRLSKISNLV